MNGTFGALFVTFMDISKFINPGWYMFFLYMSLRCEDTQKNSWFLRLMLMPRIASLELNGTRVRQNIRIREARSAHSNRYAMTPY